jgi:hypothetical protein
MGLAAAADLQQIENAGSISTSLVTRPPRRRAACIATAPPNECPISAMPSASGETAETTRSA